jgi:uncharacterized protein
MTQRWEHVTFLHWPCEPEVVQALLPTSLGADVLDGRAWVSLVPFRLTVTLPGIARVPWVSRFLETNVRTYVIDGQGRAGVWFFSLDAARLPAVLVARAVYRLPYCWSAMSIEHGPDRVHYRCRRRWPQPGPSSTVAVEIGERYRPDELSALDHWLTARWAVFSATRTHLRHALAWHPPWSLHRGRAVELDDALVTATGLPAMSGEPLVHYSPGVPVRIGPLRRSPSLAHRD